MDSQYLIVAAALLCCLAYIAIRIRKVLNGKGKGCGCGCNGCNSCDCNGNVKDDKCQK
ncbi:MAG: FeoB-associated Cys-rich membrane protein [Bacteroidales bacterium]|nr:FeoB-associated Cys-rich membrane protein [Bacteroidales bacterium]